MSTQETGPLLEADGEREFVTFTLGDEEYAIEALNVQEITGLPQITKVPYLPDFIKGVINLRGTVVPVVDLRLKFGFEAIGYTKQTCVIVSKIGDNIMGMIVDAVSEVTMLSNNCIDPTPPFGTKLNTDFMKGVGKLGGRLLIILDVDKILTGEEMTSLEAAAEAEQQGEMSAAGCAQQQEDRSVAPEPLTTGGLSGTVHGPDAGADPAADGAVELGGTA